MFSRKRLLFRSPGFLLRSHWQRVNHEGITDVLARTINMSSGVDCSVLAASSLADCRGQTSSCTSGNSKSVDEKEVEKETESSHQVPSSVPPSTHPRVRIRATLQRWNLAMLRERYRVLYATPSSSHPLPSFSPFPQACAHAEGKGVETASNKMDRTSSNLEGEDAASLLYRDDRPTPMSMPALPELDHVRPSRDAEEKRVVYRRKREEELAEGSTPLPCTKEEDLDGTIVSRSDVVQNRRKLVVESNPSFRMPDADETLARYPESHVIPDAHKEQRTCRSPSRTNSSISLTPRPLDQFDSMPFSDRWELITRSLYPLGNVSESNTVKVFKNSGDAYLAMWEAMDTAEKEVLLQTYIFKDDVVGKRTVQKLLEAKKRNCNVEVLYDDGGNISGRGKLMEPLKNVGVSVILYRPILSYLWRYMFTFNWRISPGGLRNHRKILLVDNKIGFCGGLNVGNEYCGIKAGGTGRFRDTHCVVVGPALQHLRKVYEDTKNPEPSRFSWSRWRQRAATRLRRTYHSGSSALVDRVVRPMQRRTASDRQRNRLYFRTPLLPSDMKRSLSAVRSTTLASISTSWRTSRSHTETHTLPSPVMGAGSRTTMAAMTGRLAWALPAPAPAPAPAVCAAPAVPHDASPAPPQGLRSAFASPKAFRRVQAQRFRHFAHSIVSKHRHTTKALLGKPIADEDPVPEANPYAQRVPVTTQILQSNPHNGNFSIQYAFWQVVRKCHRRVWITTPYFLPSGKHLKAMVHAARRGVDVRLLTGSQRTTDPWVMWYASTYITERLLRGGVRVFEYNGGGVMHAKTVVADSLWSSIGSFNWDPMSNKNLEVSLCHLDHPTARTMEKQFLEDQAVSVEVTLEAHLRRPRWQRLVSWLFYHCVFLVDRLTFTGFEVPDLKYTHGPEILRK